MQFGVNGWGENNQFFIIFSEFNMGFPKQVCSHKDSLPQADRKSTPGHGASIEVTNPNRNLITVGGCLCVVVLVPRQRAQQRYALPLGWHERFHGSLRSVGANIERE